LIEKASLRPLYGSLFWWRSIYITNNQMFADGLLVKLGKESQVLEGEMADLISSSELINQAPLVLAAFAKWQILSDGFVTTATDEPQVLGDMRTSFEAETLNPIRGLQIQSDGQMQLLDLGPSVLNDWSLVYDAYQKLFVKQ
jgi:hypothetical protein